MNDPKEIRTMLPDPFSGALTEPCPFCGKAVLTNAGKWQAWNICGTEDGAISCSENSELDGVPEECDCPGAVAERARVKAEVEEKAKIARQAAWQSEFEEARVSANIPAAWASRGLAVWRRNTNARETAWNAVKNAGGAICGTSTHADTKRGICIAGGVGTGKTFLASCFAVSLLRRQVDVRWSNVSDFLREVRSAFSRGGSELEVVKRFTTPTVLFFDDLGKERPTEWACEQLFSVINARYDAEMATVITTNYSLQELVARLTPRPDANGYADDTTARAIVDRLRAMCEFVVLDGRSMRN